MERFLLFLCLLFLSMNDINAQVEAEYIIYNSENGFTDSYVSALYCDSQGRMWIGTWEGVFVYENDGFTHYPYFSNGIYDFNTIGVVTDFAEDSQGNIWMSVYQDQDGGGGVHKFDGEKISIEYMPGENGLLSGFVTALYVDGNDDIWIGTFGIPAWNWYSGVQHIKEDTIITYASHLGTAPETSEITDIQKAHPNDSIVSVTAKSPIGFENGYFEIDEFGNTHIPDFSFGSTCYNIEYAGIHDIWLSTPNDIYIYNNNESWSNINNYATYIYRDSNDRIWIENGGLYHAKISYLENDEWVDYYGNGEDHPFRVLEEDLEKNLWFPYEEEGVIKFTNAIIQSDSNSVSIPKEKVADISVYPNPCTDILNIDSSINVTYQLYNTQSHLVATDDVTQGLNRIHIASLPAGIYHLLIRNKDINYQQKIIIQD